ncbi:MAG: hypothetical protein P8I93_07165 [Crocinitomicaceae bacterium]|nr:hypothetical protein [Crocinitomicaceae bacterium]
MSRLLFLYCMMIAVSIFGQHQIQKVGIHFFFNQEPLMANKKHLLKDSFSYVSISNFKFYLSEIKLVNKTQSKVYSKSDKIQLINFNLLEEEKSTFENDFISLEVPSGIDDSCYLSFVIGVDSTTSRAGNFTKSLDPTLGMYWAWNTGYIHFKLEGESNLFSKTSPKFSYHIGGYSGTYATQTHCISRLYFPLNGENNPYINIDLKDYLFKMMKLYKESMVMIPGEKAKTFANNFPMLFKQ